MTASVYITLEPANGRPVTLARIESREMESEGTDYV